MKLYNKVLNKKLLPDALKIIHTCIALEEKQFNTKKNYASTQKSFFYRESIVWLAKNSLQNFCRDEMRVRF